MSINRNQPHILVLPEDDANRQVANGFINCLNVRNTVVQVLPTARGWGDVLERFKKDYIAKMRRYPSKRMLLLIDFDGKYEERIIYMRAEIPEDLQSRVFILGTANEPENLKRKLEMSFEQIGTALSENCPNIPNDIWKDDLLIHNETELRRMVQDTESFLFIGKEYLASN